MALSKKKNVKENGQVFTPEYLVKIILDEVGYVQGRILGKHIIDNSCGDGAFLREIVRRYVAEATMACMTKSEISKDLGRYIHGIEIDPETFGNCISNLDALAASLQLPKVDWDVDNEDALPAMRFNDKMDFVVGNPPYVRVHNLCSNYDSVKTFHFAQDGMTDLYLVFFEVGFRMLNKTGKLCYITPSSWLTSLAAKNMRSYVEKECNLTALIDLGHFQAFDKITTYTLISCFDKSIKSRGVEYYSFDGENRDKVFVSELEYGDMSINGSFYLAPKKDLMLLKAILSSPDYGYAKVKNGFATLADKVFITGVTFRALTIPVIKASTSKWQRGFYPYDETGSPLPASTVFSFPEIESYLHLHKQDLLKGASEAEKPDWFLYGRTQAIKDVYSDKYSISSIVKDVESVKLNFVPSGAGVYGGLYILTSISEQELREYIYSDEFICYVSMLKNYKSGGYYTFNSKELEKYLNYKISSNERAKYCFPSDKRRVLEGNI